LHQPPLIVLARDELVDEHWQPLENTFSSSPFFARANSELKRVGAIPHFFVVALYRVADSDGDLRLGFSDRILEVALATPEMRRSARDPQLAEA